MPKKEEEPAPNFRVAQAKKRAEKLVKAGFDGCVKDGKACGCAGNPDNLTEVGGEPALMCGRIGRPIRKSLAATCTTKTPPGK